MIFSTFHIQTNLFTLLICFHNSINSYARQSVAGRDAVPVPIILHAVQPVCYTIRCR